MVVYPQAAPYERRTESCHLLPRYPKAATYRSGPVMRPHLLTELPLLHKQSSRDEGKQTTR
jgi:hypothetical protein